MKVTFCVVGKEQDPVYDEVLAHYKERLMRYAPIEVYSIPHDVTQEKEGERMLSFIKPDDFVVVLDERGKEQKSEHLAEMIENRMVDGVRRMIFIIGGAYGVSPAIIKRAQYVWKLSDLVFPHMLARAILYEQVYRAFTIIQGEKYHHQ